MRIIVLSALLIAPSLFAQGGANCRSVGGGIITNFTSDSSTLGTATGDLKGALGVDILKMTAAADGSFVLHVQHRWVTETGEALLLSEADATAYPVAAVPGLYALSYNGGVQIKGGTGKFDGASGLLTSFGAAILPRGQFTFRYSGLLCTRPVTTP